MNWLHLKTLNETEQAIAKSFAKPVLFFKHSARCSISNMALGRLNASFEQLAAEMETYQINVLEDRPVSNYLAEHFQVSHASPQILVISGGDCILDASHLDIRVSEILEEARRFAKHN